MQQNSTAGTLFREHKKKGGHLSQNSCKSEGLPYFILQFNLSFIT